MEIRFNVTGAERKALVAAVSELSGWEAVYKKAPTFAYVVNNYTIDKDGTLIFDERTDANSAAELLVQLAERGFVSEDSFVVETPTDEPVVEITADDAPDRLVIEFPLNGFSELALCNLEKLVASKSALIMKAVGAVSLTIQREADRLCFPWFTLGASENEVKVYTQFIAALCDMAKTQKRIVATEKAVDNEKYAMRCFLLRLGFIGDEYAEARKLLLSRFSGSSSFKSGAKKATQIANSAPSDEDDGIAGCDANPADNAATGSEVAAYA